MTFDAELQTGPERRMALRWGGVALMLVGLAGLSGAAWRYVVQPRLAVSESKKASSVGHFGQ